MITLSRPEVVAEGLMFPECPRWHNGALYFSDIIRGQIYRLDDQDNLSLIYEHADGYIGGLGFLECGDIIAVAQKERKLLRIRDGRAEVFADLSGVCRYILNDMIVTDDKALVSQPGFDMWAGLAEIPEPTDLVLAVAGKDAAVVSSDMCSPNGMAISEDGRTLYVAEPTAARVSCFKVDPATGDLSDRRLFGVLPDGCLPDGICLDSEGAVWAAAPIATDGTTYGPGPGVVRFTEGGGGTHLVPMSEGRQALACAIGGPERRTLYICTVEDLHAAMEPGASKGRIERLNIDFVGAGKP